MKVSNPMKLVIFASDQSALISLRVKESEILQRVYLPNLTP